MILPYSAIGWDFDGTLIDNPRSPRMHQFILDHPEKRHVIVTFRSHGWQHSIFEEMQRKYPDAPGPDCFDSVHNIDDNAWEKFNSAEQRRLLGLLTGRLTPWEEYYVEWKGMTCHHLGLPALVDDDPKNVVPGCEKYGIVYVNPVTL